MSAIETPVVADQTGEPDAAATKAIREAIAAGDYAKKGVNYAPFMVKFAYAPSFSPVWWNASFIVPFTKVTFYQFTDKTTGEFLPLGDVMTTAGAREGLGGPLPLDGGVMLLAPTAENPKALAHPLRFEWLLDDHGSGNSKDLTYWKPIAPDGYVALGICFGASPPDPSKYWCVREEELTREVSSRSIWNDGGTGWSHNGNLRAPVFSDPIEDADPGKMLLIPRVCLCEEHPDAVKPRALHVGRAQLPVTPFAPPDPSYKKGIVSEDTTTYGLGKVFIVPYTAMRGDAGHPQQASTSPFYFIAAEPYWLCTASLSTPKGGEEVTEVTIGVSQSEASSFSRATSIAISAEFGVELGPFSSSVSASYTQSFELTTERSSTKSTEFKRSRSVIIDPNPRTWFWARQTQIAVFRTGGSQINPISYGNQDDFQVGGA